jgi:hypothetical protein
LLEPIVLRGSRFQSSWAIDVRPKLSKLSLLHLEGVGLGDELVEALQTT